MKTSGWSRQCRQDPVPDHQGEVLREGPEGRDVLSGSRDPHETAILGAKWSGSPATEVSSSREQQGAAAVAQTSRAHWLACNEAVDLFRIPFHSGVPVAGAAGQLRWDWGP
jgi:hypothetical protein